MASVAYTLLKPETGLVNVWLMNIGVIDKGIPFLTDKWYWAVSYLLIAVWQNMGWGTIIYLAAMTSINVELYESAHLDGANRLQNIWYITLPGIKSTTITLLIMNLGRIMGSNFERLESLETSRLKNFNTSLPYIFMRRVWLPGISAGQLP